MAGPGEESPNLEDLVEGDEFLTEEQREEKAARERRLARKRRLQSLKEKAEEEEKKVSSVVKTPKVEVRSSPAPIRVENENGEEQQSEQSDDNDDFDIFSSSVSPVENEKKTKVATMRTNSDNDNNNHSNRKNDKVDQQQEWDDAEGYYKATIGEMIHLELATSVHHEDKHAKSSIAHVRFRVSGVIGKGVFSTVLKATTESISNSSINLPLQVAIKCIRHNETMAKAANNEIRFLQRFRKSSGIVPLLLPTDTIPLEFRGHTMLVFPYMTFNLRDVLAKFGKGVGLSLTAVRSYFGQLLAAATHLKQHNIIHSDLKPDNILVSEDFSTVRLCDFGSAVDSNESFEMITPYLVSRFYRAPEIILGLVPTFAIDLWSLAVTVAELFLGKVLFHGVNNNDMLRVMMQHMGPFSNRLIRQHLVQTKKFPLPAHFTQEAAAFFFRQESVDPVSGKPVHKTVSLQTFSATLQAKLLKAKSTNDSRTFVLRFSDLLQKCLTLDPTRRVAVKVALHHDFFKDNSTAKSTSSKASK